MLMLDYVLFASTQANPGGPIVQYIEDETGYIEPSVDADGKPTRASQIGYLIAYAIVFSALAYFLLL